MDSLITMHDRSLSQLSQNLWMDDDRVVQLHRAGHVIGLHSHTHPTRLANLDSGAQREEYRRNSQHLAGILGTSPVCMSHPCNSYNDDTLHILRELGVVLGFRANLAETRKSELEYPRADHANILAEMPA